MRTNKPKELYIFLHIPKTGGTSFRFHLKRFLRKDEVLFLYPDLVPGLTSNKATGKFIASLSEEQKAKLKIIIGHRVYYGVHKYFPGRDVRYVAFFRHPVSRMISRYNYARSHLKYNQKIPGMKIEILKNGQVIDFWSFFENSFFCQDPLYHFLIRRGFGVKGISDRDQIDYTKQILSKFYFIGLTERSNEDFGFLAYQLKLSPLMVRLNISKIFFKPVFNEELITKLKDNNERDYEIYQWAIQLNNQKKDDHFYSIIKKIRFRKFFGFPYFLIFSLFFNFSEFFEYNFSGFDRFLGFINNFKKRCYGEECLNYQY